MTSSATVLSAANQVCCMAKRGALGAFYGLVLVLALFVYFLIIPSSQNPYNERMSTDDDFVQVFTKTGILRGGDAAPEKPSWMIPWIPVHTNPADFQDPSLSVTRLLTANFFISPGLGNLMFQYASLFAISQKYNCSLVLPESLLLRRSFTLREMDRATGDIFVDDRLSVHLVRTWNRTKVLSCCKYEPETVQQLLKQSDLVTTTRVSLTGYFQSFKYFHSYKNEILQRFDFLAPVQRLAKEVVRKAIKEKGLLLDSVITVGVHARRGVDLTMNNKNVLHGHTVAPKKYFDNAMTYFRDQFRSSNKTVIFLMTSDDVYWARQNWRQTADVLILAQGVRYREVDLAILASCQHVIMSTGTFSWWAAYLAGGETVYYENWPRSGSAMYKMFRKDDFFLPNWIPML